MGKGATQNSSNGILGKVSVTGLMEQYFDIENMEY
jgi:hypothetical protein